MARLMVRIADRAVLSWAPLKVQRRLAELPALRRSTAQCHEGEINGVPGLWVQPPASAPGGVLLYLHGGGFVLGSARSYRSFAAALAKAAGMPCFLPDYRLAPAHPFPAAPHDSFAVYQGLLASGWPAERIVIAGDSAGGGLALGLAMTVRDRGLPPPALVAMLCPWLDVTPTAHEDSARRPRPPLTARTLRRWSRLYARPAQAGTAQASPLVGDLRGLPPLLVHSADGDLLATDADRLEALAASSGVTLEHKRHVHMWHGFHLFTGLLGESDAAVTEWGEQIRRSVPIPRRKAQVAIVGAGVSGICLAAKLAAAGLADYTVYEKADDLGGTWRENRYPGLRCDVPSRLYSYSFAAVHAWKRLFSTGREIHQYLRNVAADHGVLPHIRYGVQVTAARWDETQWRLETSAGPATADILVTATGFLHTPRTPAIPGLDAFEGALRHAARWDDSADPAGRRVAVIGTGSTGVQLTNALAGDADHLLVFQRTAQWIAPVPNPRLVQAVGRLYQRRPGLGRASRHCLRTAFEAISGTSPLRAGWARTALSTACRLHLRLAVRDPDLRRRLRPDHAPMCKRLIVDSMFYRSLQRDDVELVDTPIARIEKNGIVTGDGRFHPVDIIVLATGFDSQAYVRPMKVTGLGGRTLDRAWANGPTSYASVALPGFPNFFMMIGPYSPVGNQSQVTTAETHADYIIGWIRTLYTLGPAAAVMPTVPATETFLAQADAAASRTVWASGCSSWYQSDNGSLILWPWSPRSHRKYLRRPRLADFEFIDVTSAGPRRDDEVSR
ncbi:alpha/beta hydrolase fold domain-containing protein [Streptomyces sp. CB02923]|uniref:alpha/beta hydrolase fold domain-containing protein n=1 Tax=Streptomyces sp. CB02923 TaxID=1718985 RepID=UPI001901D6B2|nr:alpha/beta hydrolase fold domain-containing protein [Streptomyces sp. CB02923]